MKKPKRRQGHIVSYLSEVHKAQCGAGEQNGSVEFTGQNTEEIAKDENKSSSYEEALAQVPANKEHNDVANSALSRDEQTSQSKEKAAADNAEQRRRVHTVYEQYFISFMRIRYAWCIFSLLICWLGVDLVVLFANAMGALNAKVLFICVASLGGAWVGNMIVYSLWGRQNIKDVKSYYTLTDEAQRIDFEGKNIQLRLWRSVRGSWGCVVGALIGLVVGHSVSRCWWPFGESSVQFHLSDPVIMTLIGSSTASVIGVFLIVLHWLFPHEDEENDKKKKETKSNE